MKLHITFIVIFVLIVSSQAGITIFDETFEGIHSKLWRYAVVTRENSIFGNEDPFLRIECIFNKIPLDDTMPDAQLLLFHHQNLWTKVGDMESFQWCCTQQLYDSGKCSNPGSIIIHDYTKMNWTDMSGRYLMDGTKTLLYWPNYNGYINGYDPITQQLQVKEQIIFNKMGVWYFLISHCNISHSERVQGLIEWKNPYGFLSGSLFPFLPMYISISIAYFILLLVWTIFLIRYRDDLMGLQHVITLSIIIALAENVLWGIDYMQYNSTGLISNFVNMIGALLTAGKLTVIRTCILLVALGYSITVPCLERRTKYYVVALTIVYGIDATLQEYVWVIRTMGLDFPILLEIAIEAILITANMCYVMWIGYSLYNHFKSLAYLKQTQKLNMYKKFSLYLVIFLTISVILYFIQNLLNIIGESDDLWQMWWIWDAYWEFGYYFVVLLMAVLWWPNENNTRYAYSVQIDGEELGDIGLPTDDSEDEPNTKLDVPEDDISDIKGAKVGGHSSDSDSAV